MQDRHRSPRKTLQRAWGRGELITQKRPITWIFLCLSCFNIHWYSPRPLWDFISSFLLSHFNGLSPKLYYLNQNNDSYYPHLSTFRLNTGISCPGRFSWSACRILTATLKCLLWLNLHWGPFGFWGIISNKVNYGIAAAWNHPRRRCWTKASMIDF